MILKARLTSCLVRNILKAYFQKFMSTCPLGRAAIPVRKRYAKSCFLFLSSLVIPILMSMSDCCGCGPGAAGGVGTGFEPVPECTEGAIHPWGIEGAQPEDRVSTAHVSKTRSNS